MCVSLSLYSVGQTLHFFRPLFIIFLRYLTSNRRWGNWTPQKVGRWSMHPICRNSPPLLFLAAPCPPPFGSVYFLHCCENYSWKPTQQRILYLQLLWCIRVHMCPQSERSSPSQMFQTRSYISGELGDTKETWGNTPVRGDHYILTITPLTMGTKTL